MNHCRFKRASNLACSHASIAVVFAVLITTARTMAAPAADAGALLKAAFDNWRANSSQTTMTMTVHRPEWERHMSMLACTRSEDKALVRFIAPPKDAGNATLKLGAQMWVYNPKLNQVIKLPASMIAQPWMGSDFSYNDLAKADDVLTEYTHHIVASTHVDGHTVFDIEAIPKPGAPVVWGKQALKVRDDGVLLQQEFYDQDMKLVRTMNTDKVAILGGRDYPVVITMHPAENENNWTRIETTQGKFNISLPDYLFTQSNLENPRDR